MKKIIGVFLLVFCYSCADNTVKDVFDKTPEQRISAIKEQYKEMLLQAPHGWKTYFGTSDKLGRWLILMDFDDKGQVVMKCDPVDYYYISGVAFNDPITYRIDYSQNAELVFESFSQFSAWNEFVVDSDGDGYGDKYAGPETQFIIERYQDGKFYMKGKSNIGVGKKESEIMTYVFEQAKASDWDLAGITNVKKAINYDEKKGKYQRLQYKGKFLENFFLVDAESRVVLYRYLDEGKDDYLTLPFYITETGFSLVTPLKIKGVGTVQHFVADLTNNTITEEHNKDLTIAYTDQGSAVLRMNFESFDKLYLSIDVYHSTGDPIGRNLKKVFDDLRPPYASNKQQLNVIYYAKNIDKDMRKTPFKYAQELTLIYADADPSYSGNDIYGENPTFVRIPVEYESTVARMWVISLAGSVEQAFIDAYPTDVEYAKQKAKQAMPMLYKLMDERGWGLYAQNTTSSNPTVKVVDEDDPAGSFFTLYPFTQADVNK